MAHYHHAVPFRREPLTDLFAQCETSEHAEKCAEVKREAEALIGPLGGGDLPGFARRRPSAS